ncbi:MAG: radical SAM family heme chaperone HemW [Candidatus Omnitrophota bacterium]|jgi:oxygen-independent coproporphyrinogen-3 oxidase
MPQSLYVHIPFCRKKCVYCDFYSSVYNCDIAEAYIKVLSAEARKLQGIFKTIYIGGGTPTVLEKGSLVMLLESLKGRFGPETEFTIEANPESLTEEKVQILLDHGVNRLSIGVQSIRDRKLQKLGRVHDSKRAVDSVILADRKGFKNISIDLIYGVWDEDGEAWKEELEEVVKLPVKHISCYGLTYEKETPLFEALKSGSVKPLEDEAVAAMYECTIDRLAVRGFKQYEISNYSKEGYQSAHNMNYWDNGPYTGLGASAVTYQDGSRAENVSDAEEYIKRILAGKSPIASSEKLSPVRRAKETAALKIRTREGIDFKHFKDNTGYDFVELEKRALKDLEEEGLIKYLKDGDMATGVCLRRRGFLFCDTVSSSFL